MTPGPAPVPEAVLLELHGRHRGHRSDEAKEVIKEVTTGLKDVFQTTNDVLIITASGTPCDGRRWRAVNVVLPGKKAIVLNAGYFWARWGSICNGGWHRGRQPRDRMGTSGSTPIRSSTPSRQHPDAAGVFATLSETSTATGHPVEAIGKIAGKTDAVLAVDGISGVGRDGVPDRRLGDRPARRRLAEGPGMLPPGLAFLAVSDEGAEEGGCLRREELLLQPEVGPEERRRNWTRRSPRRTPWSSPSRTSLRMIRAEGIENVWEPSPDGSARRARPGSRPWASNPRAARPAEGLTAFRVPEVAEGLRDPQRPDRSGPGITVVGWGQDKLKGQILRVGHMGYMDELDVVLGPGGPGDRPERPRATTSSRAAPLTARSRSSSTSRGRESRTRRDAEKASCAWHRVLVTDKLAEEGLDLLRSQPGLEVVVNTKLDPAGLRAALAEADGIVIRSGTQLTAGHPLRTQHLAQGDRPLARGRRSTTTIFPRKDVRRRRSSRMPNTPGIHHRLDGRAHDGPDPRPAAQRRPGELQPHGRQVGPEQVHRQPARRQDAGDRRPGAGRPGRRRSGRRWVRHERGRLRPVPVGRAGRGAGHRERLTARRPLGPLRLHHPAHLSLEPRRRHIVGAREIWPT